MHIIRPYNDFIANGNFDTSVSRALALFPRPPESQNQPCFRLHQISAFPHVPADDDFAAELRRSYDVAVAFRQRRLAGCSVAEHKSTPCSGCHGGDHRQSRYTQ